MMCFIILQRFLNPYPLFQLIAILIDLNPGYLDDNSADDTDHLARDHMGAQSWHYQYKTCLPCVASDMSSLSITLHKKQSPE